MNDHRSQRHYRLRWPDTVVPEGEPTWILYEVDKVGDAVLRTVDLYDDERITRNSIEIEERSGKSCPSLIDDSLSKAFQGLDRQPITKKEFEASWQAGKDKPFWFPQ